MKKWLAIALVLALGLWGAAAPAEPGAADVRLEGQAYHLTLVSVGVVGGRLTLVMDGFGDTLRMDESGAVLPGTPEARYGDEVVAFSAAEIAAGAPLTFTFDRDALPDEIWVRPRDAGEEPVLLWTAADAGEDDAGKEDAGEDDAGEAEAESGGGLTAFFIPEVPVIEVPEIKVPDVPKAKETAAPKIEVPEIPKVELPQAEPPRVTAPDDAGSDAKSAGDASAGDGARDAADPEAVLDALGVYAYRATYALLLEGGAVGMGSRGEAVRGVQRTLADLGRDVAADGAMGPGTLAALNAAQAELGLKETRTLDAAGYAQLLSGLLTGEDR